MSFAPIDGLESVAYIVITHVASALSVVGGATTAIILCTVAIRLALLPLTLRSVRAERARARLAPRVAALRKRYAKRPDRLAQELTALYRAEDTSPVAGLGSMLLQAPVFLLLNRLFYASSIHGHGNALLGYGLFGTPLGARFITHPYPLFGLLAVLLLALACWSSWRAGQVARANAAPAAPTLETRLIGGLGRVAPFATVLVALFLPLAAGLYVMTSTVLRRGLPPVRRSSGS
jgi:YidC/Oxa1 family membrane protein insertase